jgi:hypothetical protein
LLGSREAHFKFLFNCAGRLRFTVAGGKNSAVQIRFSLCGWLEKMLSEEHNEKFASGVF